MPNSSVMYTGVEVEGKWAGIPTLFLEGSEFTEHNRGRIMDAIRESTMSHLYLGVHNRPVDWSFDTIVLLRYLLETHPALFVTVEQPLTKVWRLPTEVWQARVRVIFQAGVDDIDLLIGRQFELKLDGCYTAVIFEPKQFIDTTYLKDIHVDPSTFTRTVSGRDN